MLSKPAAMPSVTTPSMSAPVLSTQLWPITFFAIWPVWARLTVKVLQLLSTPMALVLNCIWSVAWMSTEHSAAHRGALNRPSRDRAASLRNIRASRASWA
ncbi:hypothetical protein D3C78_1305070 [compost metagenome]